MNKLEKEDFKKENIDEYKDIFQLALIPKGELVKEKIIKKRCLMIILWGRRGSALWRQTQGPPLQAASLLREWATMRYK